MKNILIFGLTLLFCSVSFSGEEGKILVLTLPRAMKTEGEKTKKTEFKTMKKFIVWKEEQEILSKKWLERKDDFSANFKIKNSGHEYRDKLSYFKYRAAILIWTRRYKEGELRLFLSPIYLKKSIKKLKTNIKNLLKHTGKQKLKKLQKEKS